MSPPTFPHHVRQLTAVSPLQYQKWLRLNDARRLMLNEHLDVPRAAFSVGYESPSQFSREYSRLFGVATLWTSSPCALTPTRGTQGIGGKAAELPSSG